MAISISDTLPIFETYDCETYDDNALARGPPYDGCNEQRVRRVISPIVTGRDIMTPGPLPSGVYECLWI